MNRLTATLDGLQLTDHRPGDLHLIRAWKHVPGAPPREFCLETESGQALERDGKPWVMSFEQGSEILRILQQGDEASERDVFRHLDEFPITPRVQIVAPGPRGREYWCDLDSECYTIVVNKACEIADIRKDLWMVADPPAHTHKEHDTAWFQYGLDHHFDIAAFDGGKLFLWNPTVPRTFETGPYMRPGDIEPFPFVLRGGCTITGQAVQLAYWLGADEIVLCGVDLEADAYFDGTKTGMPQRDEPWDWCIPQFQELCDWLKAHGIRIRALSATALEIEKIPTENLLPIGTSPGPPAQAK